jgi:hypothetical protein
MPLIFRLRLVLAPFDSARQALRRRIRNLPPAPVSSLR